jgi:uncharacterized membrane protein
MPALAAARTALCTAAVAALIVTFGVLARPLLHSGFPAGHDAPAHVTYTYLFNRAIAEGQFPVRWVDGVRAGYSQPLFNFYQPGFYYLVAITHLAVPSLALSLKITVGVSWALGAVFMYLLFRPLGRLPGILAASLFICSPYILLDVFVRSAYPELAAVALAPGLLWAIQRATDRPRPGYLGALAGLTALALVCHLPTFLIFSPLFATALAVGLLNPGRRRRALAAALACGIGAGLSAFYVIPALGELHLTRISELTSNYFDFHRHFVAPNQWFRYSWAYGASTEGTSDQMSFQIGVAQLIAIAGALAGLVWLLATRRSGATASAVIAWLTVLALALFLMTAHSVVLWETVPALAYLQFPWRLLMVVTVACGAIGAYALSLVPSRGAQAAIVLAAVVGQLALVHHYARPKAYIPQAQMDIDRSGWKYTRSAYEAAFVEPGYFPAGVRTLPPPGIREWQVISGNASVTADLVTAVRVVLTVDAETDAVVRTASHAFPGWSATVDGRAAVPRIDSDLGFLTVAVPRGRHHVDVSFENTPIRTLGNAISVASAVAFVALVLVSARWRA